MEQREKVLEQPLTPKTVNFVKKFYSILTLPSDVDDEFQTYHCVREVAFLLYFTFATTIIKRIEKRASRARLETFRFFLSDIRVITNQFFDNFPFFGLDPVIISSAQQDPFKSWRYHSVCMGKDLQPVELQHNYSRFLFLICRKRFELRL